MVRGGKLTKNLCFILGLNFTTNRYPGINCKYFPCRTKILYYYQPDRPTSGSQVTIKSSKYMVNRSKRKTEVNLFA